MREFHAIVRPLGECVLRKSGTFAWGDATIDAWQVADPSVDPGWQGFGFSYECLAKRLSAVPRLFIEPDGSFVWVASADPARSISGQITDDGQQVVALELRGRCQWEEMTLILRELGWPEAKLVFQLLPWAVLVKTACFRAAGFAENR